MKDRVKQIQDHFNLSQLQFANELAVAPATISSIYKGRTAPTNNLVQAIHQAFPSISIPWLMFGEGEMLEGLSMGATSADSSGPEIGQNFGFETSSEGSLFDPPRQPQMSSAAPLPAQKTALPTELQLVEALSQLKMKKEHDKPQRKIKEIRVFFDDGTYESFGPLTK